VTRRILALLAVGLVVALAAPSPAPAEPDCAQQHRRVRLPEGFAAARLSFTGVARNGRARVGAQFETADLREMRIVADWTEIEGGHLQRLELYSPDGSLYQRFTGTFSGTGRPVSVSTRLMVTGTSIVDSGLYGEWCAELFLDDEDAPIARRGFELIAPSP
jgi:hypothetical protein